MTSYFLTIVILKKQVTIPPIRRLSLHSNRLFIGYKEKWKKESVPYAYAMHEPLYMHPH